MTLQEANVQLERVRRKIARLDARLDKSHGLGDDESAMGSSSSHRDNLEWETRQDRLQACEDYLLAYIQWMNGGRCGCPPASPFRSWASFSRY